MTESIYFGMNAMHENSLSYVSMASERQIAFAKGIGVDVSGKSVRVAWALIEDAIQREFWGNARFDSPTEKQVALAAKFGFDISQATRRVGAAVIDDIMFQLNTEAIVAHKLAPGVRVVNIHDNMRRRMIISSIADDGTVFFRGGNGARA
jgi:hypothetical protein